MRKKIYFSLTVLLLTAIPALTWGQPSAGIGENAPGFKLTDSKGNTHSLSDYIGKYVVMEWINFECPFVKKHYNSRNMQNLQKEFTDKEIVWLAVCSSAEGKQGYFSDEEINKRIAEHGAYMTAYLKDADGSVGKNYGAKTTPHMFVINPQGVLIYSGAIDDKPSTDINDIKEANNYVRAAFESSLSNQEIENKITTPYGCSVKY